MWRGRSLTLAAASGIAAISARQRRDAARSEEAKAPDNDVITLFIEKQLGPAMVEVANMLQNLYSTFADELDIPVEDRHKVLLSAAVVKVISLLFPLLQHA
jgi:hypothetical protein